MFSCFLRLTFFKSSDKINLMDIIETQMKGTVIMKKSLLGVLIAILAIGVIVGLVFAFSGKSDTDATPTTTTTTITTTTAEVNVPTPPEQTAEGLAYELNPDGESYTLMGIGDYAGVILNIPATHNGKPVTAVANEAFKFNRTIIEVYIPNAVTEMGEGAFSYCDSLEVISIGSGLTHIPRFAFVGADVKDVVIPDTVTSVDYTAFWNCESLESIWIGKGVKKLGASYDEYEGTVTFSGFGDFSGCRSLESIMVSKNHSSFVSVDGNLYSKDKSLIVKYAPGKKDATFVLPEQVRVIDKGAFYNSFYLEEMTIPSSVKKVCNWAFQNSESLRQITFCEGVSEIERWVLSDCLSLVEIVVEEGNSNYKSVDGNLLTKDGKVFMQYTLGSKAEKFVIPEGVEKIQNASFSGANNLLEVEIPEGVKVICSGAFEKCEKLERVSLPSTLEEIESSTFCFSYQMSNIVYNGTKDMWNGMNKNSIWDNGMSAYSIKCTDGTIISE